MKNKKRGWKSSLWRKRPAGFNKGYFYEPTIIDNIKDDFSVMTEEPFGPITAITTFKNFDEVIKRANKHDCGLAGYVCTNSMEKAFKASEQLETGVVAVNTPVVATAETPFGGTQTNWLRKRGWFSRN